jgi:hypothetical protein
MLLTLLESLAASPTVQSGVLQLLEYLMKEITGDDPSSAAGKVLSELVNEVPAVTTALLSNTPNAAPSPHGS